jgi:hypothetical protein
MPKKLKLILVSSSKSCTPYIPYKALKPSFFPYTMDGQDWTTVTMKRTPSKPSAQKVAAAQAAVHAARMDSDDVKMKRKRLTTESRQALVAARCAEKKGQRDVDKELAFPPNTIRDFEAGTAAPSGAQISALQRRFAAVSLVLRIETV